MLAGRGARQRMELGRLRGEAGGFIGVCTEVTLEEEDSLRHLVHLNTIGPMWHTFITGTGMKSMFRY